MKEKLSSLLGIALVFAMFIFLATISRTHRSVELPTISLEEYNQIEVKKVEPLVYTGAQIESLLKCKDSSSRWVVANNSDIVIYDNTKLISIGSDSVGDMYYELAVYSDR